MADQVLQSPTNPHFFQPLLPGFDSFLNIPVKFFSAYIKGRNEGQTVELRSDASEKSWKVKMEGRRLTVGWKEFVSAHDLRIGDVLIFRHEGALVFHVTSFGPSSCEIQYVQSSNDDDSLDDDQENIRKPPRKEHVKKRTPEAEAEPFSLDESCFIAHVTYSNLREDTLFLPRKFAKSNGLNKGSNKIVLTNEGVRTWTLILKSRDSSRRFYMRGGWRSFCHENGLKTGDSVTFKLKSNNTKTPLLLFSIAEPKSVSTKDSSEGKINKSGDSCQNVPPSSSSVSENRFLTLPVTPASIQCSRLYLPKNFTRVNNMEKAGGQTITLLDKHGVEWPVTLLMDTYGRMRLTSGLKKFISAIGVKAYESIVLELVWEETSTLPMFKFCSKITRLDSNLHPSC